MAKGSKTGRKATLAAQAKPVEESGPRFLVVRDGRPVYGGRGLPLERARQLQEGLLEPAELLEVPSDG